MPKSELHDLREYTLLFNDVDLSNLQEHSLPIPQAGQVLRMGFLTQDTTSGISTITFILGSNQMELGGSPASLIIPDGILSGVYFVQKFDPNSKSNYVFEGEEGDGSSDGSSIFLFATGSTTCIATIALTIRQ